MSKEDGSGIDIHIKPGTVHESVHIPVIISESGLSEVVYNDFYVGENSDVVIVAGCGISNCGQQDSEHDGIHRFFVGKNAKVKYVEKHYGEGDGNGKRILNPVTEVYMDEGSYMEMEMVQIKGVDSTIRKTEMDQGASAHPRKPDGGQRDQRPFKWRGIQRQHHFPFSGKGQLLSEVCVPPVWKCGLQRPF